MREGTSNKTAGEIAELLDYYGAFLEKTDFCIAKIQRSDNLYYLIDNKEAQMKLLVHVKWLIL